MDTNTPAELRLPQNDESVAIHVYTNESTSAELQQQNFPEVHDSQPPPTYDELNDPNGK